MKMKGKKYFLTNLIVHLYVFFVCVCFLINILYFVYNLKIIVLCKKFNFDKIYVLYGVNSFFTWNHGCVKFGTFRRSAWRKGKDVLPGFSFLSPLSLSPRQSSPPPVAHYIYSAPWPEAQKPGLRLTVRHGFERSLSGWNIASRSRSQSPHIMKDSS